MEMTGRHLEKAAGFMQQLPAEGQGSLQLGD
jgi:hypothetical protein